MTRVFYPGSCSSIGDVLSQRAQESPGKAVYTFLSSDIDDSNRETLTFGQLDDNVTRIAGKLNRPDLFQERAILFFNPGLAYIRAFFACMRAGVIAIPAYPPRTRKRNDRNMQRLLGVIDDAQPRLAVTTAALYEQARTMFAHTPALENLEWILIDDPASVPTSSMPEIKSEHIAFLQYTSGSTSTPKGVMVSHGNLMANEAMISETFETTPQTTCVGWLPLFHDMGLIGNVIQPVYAGFTCHLMAPTTFLRKPVLWLQAIDRYGAVVSGGPNFAYELCARSITPEQSAGLDLSSWRVAFNGSEPIRSETLAHFSQRFAECGFRASAHFPCYGLAEATLLVSGRPRSGVLEEDFREDGLAQNQALSGGDENKRRLVSSGAVTDGQQVRIVSSEGKVLPSGRIGEIWVSGPHVALGYWNKADVNRTVFQAETDTGEGPFMRTGDLGFLHRDQLFITGRLKDLIILRGRNHYPQDIEQTVQAASVALKADAGAAFTVEADSEERLVVVQEVERSHMRRLDAASVIQDIRHAVSEAHEIRLHAVLLIRPAAIPKTTSGKIRRSECRRLYLEDQFREVGSFRTEPGQTAEAVIAPLQAILEAEAPKRMDLLKPYLQSLLAATLDVPAGRIDSDRPLTALGLDSLAAVTLIQRLEEDLGVAFPLDHLLDGPTPNEVAEWLAQAPLGQAVEPLPQPSEDGALSINQRALWLLHRLSPESNAYNISVAARLVNDPAFIDLSKALEALALRHPSLRTVFTDRDGDPRQEVMPQPIVALEEIDASSWDDDKVRREAQMRADQPLDLSRAPWQMFYFKRNTGQSLLLLVIHHVIADLQSVVIFFRELGILCGENAGPLAPPAADYSRFVAQQQQQLAGSQGEAGGDWWKQCMTPPPPVLTLPTDKPRPAVQGHVGASHDFSLGTERVRAVEQIAADHGATPFMVLLAAWQVLLHRYSGQVDFCVGSPTAGRRERAFAGVIGDFVNPVAFRSDLHGKPSFSRVLDRVADRVRSGLAHADYPFEMLVEKVCPGRDPSFSPIFQVMFSLQKAPQMAEAAPFILGGHETVLETGGLELAPFPLQTHGAQVDLALVTVDGETMPSRLIYDTALFLPQTVVRMADHLRNLLDLLLEQPEQPINQPSLMSSEEQERLLHQWNATQTAFDHHQTLHGLFAATAAGCPNEIALVFGRESEQALTYEELGGRVNELARGLRQQGVGPETPVGLCLERGPQLVAAMLAVLQAGGAYVPLDPAHPASRTTQIVADSGMKLMLADRDDLQYSGVGVMTPDQLADSAPQQVAMPPVEPHQLAYIIYTSGSTGRPKGVQVCHHSVVNFLQSMAVEPGLGAGDALLAVTTVSFDIAGLELFLPLLQGARLVLATSDETVDGRILSEKIEHHGVTVMQATPTTWRLLLESGYRGSLKALCGGEALPGKLSADILEAGMSLWNMYGPTETTIWSAVRRINQNAAATAVEPVGTPIANTQIFILDPEGKPVPMGVPGELNIAGDGLARGYYNRPDLTAAAFVPNAFGPSGSRRYRTGDLARLLPDGTMDFMGRLDFQIKLRGFRIEIGEIEAALAKHPGIRESVVHLTGSGAQARLTAYLVPDTPMDEARVAAEMREHLRRDLPEYMLPSHFMILDAFPLTPNNKVDRKALPEPRTAKRTGASAMPASGLEAAISEIWRELLEVPHVGTEDNFFDLGGHSLLLSRANNRMREKLNLPLTMVEMFQYPTISALAAHIRGKGAGPVTPASGAKDIAANEPIAIVGMACRFPGAADVESFWKNLDEGRSSLVTYDDDSLLKAGVSPDLLKHPDYVRVGAFLDEAELFDARFFDFSPLDAALIDPQQRVFLEICWHALESAGYSPDRDSGAIGVFAGSGMNTYLSNNLLTNPGLVETEGEYRLMTTNDKDFLATRVAYKLDLSGPAINIQTACSTSLVAVHEACKSLRQGECDMALAGGSTIRVPGNVGYLYRDGLVFSPDGTCRAFDKDAGGTVPGSGAGVVLLKRLSRAMEDGDEIVAVIEGSAINNDASRKVGYTAPGVDGQQAVIAAAHAAAGVDPETITYVEAHGTGTRMGDPIEMAALSAAFRAGTDKTGFCAVGSVKTNIGHLDSAAGVAGLIKTALALKHGRIPASLGYQTPNPEIDFQSGPFYVNQQAKSWETPEGQPRRAGISSFGIGGTNVHAVLKQAPAPAETQAPQQTRDLVPIVLSARSEAALNAATANLAAYLAQRPDQDPTPVARSLATGRKRFEHRRFVICSGSGDAAGVLGDMDPKRVFTRRDEQRNRRIVFLFPGQGAQYAHMTAAIYRNEPVFAELVDKCSKHLESSLGLDLRSLLYPQPESETDATEQLARTQYTQPALFVVSYALARLLQQWGIQPQALLGHSVGEYVAATLAGVFALEDALDLVAERGRLIAQLPGGSMLSIPAGVDEVKSKLNQRLSLAAVNAPGMCVVSGDNEAIDALAADLALGGLETRKLRTSHAFHSYMMDPILEDFAKKVEAVDRHAPKLTVISNLTGKALTEEQAMDPAYWTGHLRQAVRFADGLTTLFEDPEALMLEVGPGRTLTTLARRHPKRGANRVLLNLLPPAAQYREERLFFLEGLGKLWLTGVSVDFDRILPAGGESHDPLPLYPFQRQHYWIEPGQGRTAKPDTDQKKERADWYYMPSWKRTVALPKTVEPSEWLLFSDRQGVTDHLAELLKEKGHRVIRVAGGDRFSRVGEDSYTLNSDKPGDYKELFTLLDGMNRKPATVVHCHNITGNDFVDANTSKPFFELMGLARALAEQEDMNCLLAVVGHGMQDVFGEGVRHPQKAMASGILTVLPQEHKDLRCRLLDMDPALPARATAAMLYDELSADTEDTEVAYRGKSRWTRCHEPLAIEAPRESLHFRQGGVYLITGGLGGIGLALARDLAIRYQASLALISRSALPDREAWDIASGKQAVVIQNIRAMEAAGATVLPLAADVSDLSSLEAAVTKARTRFGTINGVLHCAGLPGGGAIAHRSREDMEKVLAAKVSGTLALDRVFAADPPEFMALFSSINAVLGGFGQADYAAANTFMDAYALGKQNGSSHVISINWDSWRDIGMAASALEQASGKVAEKEPEGVPVSHPLLDLELPVQGATATYHTVFDVDRHWPLHEHWIMDRAILPGTTYLEMARAALEQHTGATRVTFRDTAFLSPLIVAQGEQKRVRTQIENAGDHHNFKVSSRLDNGTWLDHAAGQLHPVDQQALEYDLKQLIAAHGDSVIEDPLSQVDLGGFHLERGKRPSSHGDIPLTVITDGQTPPAVSIELGRRWHTARWVRIAAESGMALLELDADLRDDLRHYKLHPALLDFAVGYLRLFKDQANYLPLSYKRLTLHQPLPARFYSHIAFAADYKADRGNPIFDIQLIAEDGTCCVDIEGFALGKIDGARLEEGDKVARQRQTEMEAFTRHWMTPEEGIDAFYRAMASNLPRLVVSTRDLEARKAESVSTETPGSLHGEGFQRPVQPRPDLMNPYVAARNAEEEKMAEIWQQVMGLEQVGIYDDFNDLGGDSLLITNIHGRIKETYPESELSVAELMQYPNIADLVAYMKSQGKPKAEAKREEQGMRRERQAQSKKTRNKLKAARRRNPLSRSKK